MQRNMILLLSALLGLVFLPLLCGCAPPVTGTLDLAKIRLPDGFEISLYADNLPGARSMALGDNGTLFVTTRDKGFVYAVMDHDRDHNADEVITIARGLNQPNGVAFLDGVLYIAEADRIIKYENAEANLSNLPDPLVIRDGLPPRAGHTWKYLELGPDGKLYFTVGAPCNSCEDDDEYFASILRINTDGSGLEPFALGVRNSVGFAWHPETEELWFTDNGRDLLGDDMPPDELNHAPVAGLHFGYPYCHGGDILDPEFGKEGDCDLYTAPQMKLGPHVAALGMTFYTGGMFPAEYTNRIFIAEHGSWDRSVPIGYRVTMVRLENNQAVSYETFAEGWLEGSTSWGRPVDLLMMPDGSLLVSDDKAGVVYRIVFTAQ